MFSPLQDKLLCSHSSFFPFLSSFISYMYEVNIGPNTLSPTVYVKL